MYFCEKCEVLTDDIEGEEEWCYPCDKEYRNDDGVYYDKWDTDDPEVNGVDPEQHCKFCHTSEWSYHHRNGCAAERHRPAVCPLCGPDASSDEESEKDEEDTEIIVPAVKVPRYNLRSLKRKAEAME
jgi:hypothetical protein